MKKEAFIFIFYFTTLFVLQAQTLTQKFYFDFGQDNPAEGRHITVVDTHGNYWNNVVAPNGSPSTLNPTSFNLKNSENATTVYAIEVVRPIRSNGGANGGLLSPDPTLLGDLAVASATEDYLFLDNGMGKGLFIFKHLDTSKAYKFYIYGCRTASGNQRGIVYSLSGKNGSHGKQLNTGTGIGANAYNGNNNNVWESAFVVPADNGEIILELGRLFNNEMAYISALKIEEYSDYVLPSAEMECFIDFGKNNNGLDGAPTVSPDINANYWNNIYSNGDGPTRDASDGTNMLTLKNSANQLTAYVLELASPVEFNGVRNGALGGADSPSEPTTSLLGDLAIKTATYDYLFINNATAILHFKNLKANKLYRFNIFGSRKDDGSEGRVGRIQLTGNKTITGIHQMGGAGIGANRENYNNKNVFVSDLISPSATGQITLSLTTWLGFSHINCIKLEEISGETLPAATSINVSGSSSITNCGRFVQLSVNALPEGALCPPVTWKVDNNDLAHITDAGNIYAKENGIVLVTATATLEGGATLTDTKQITISGQNVGDNSLTVMGSSVPWGQGASPRDVNGYAWLWTNYLQNNAATNWTTNNISIGGNNTTNVADRWDNDLLPSCSRYVFYGLSLRNEGIHERGKVAYDSWRDNMLTLIERSRNHGKVPVVGNNYPRGDFNATDYDYLKQLNLLIHEWDVASVNLLGAIDNGAGQWASGYVADNAHPNTAGHAEMFYAIVPSLLDAISAGKPQPVRNTESSIRLERLNSAKQIIFTPENVTHSFTLSFAFKTTSTGTVASFVTAKGDTARLILGNDGKLTYNAHSSAVALNDGNWHTATLTHYYAWGKTQLYIDGARIPRTSLINEQLVPVKFIVNDVDNAPQSVDYRELFFYRAGMCAEEINALYEGKMLKSSLEIYAPLFTEENSSFPLVNMAQSLNTLQIEKQEIPTGLNASGFDSYQHIKEIVIYSITGQRLLCTTEPYFGYDDKLQTGMYLVKTTNDKNETNVKVVLK